MNSLWHDLRFAARGFRQDKTFTLVAILALALGIGSTTAIFSVVENVLLEPFPYHDPSHLMSVFIHDMSRGEPLDGRPVFSIPEFLDFAGAAHSFDQVLGVTQEDVLHSSGEGTERFQGADVTANTFSYLGVKSLLGRAISPEDGKPGAPPVFVMSYKVWFKNYSLDPKILGRTFVLNDKPRTLVGIMPPRFAWWGADLWIPTALDRSDPDAKTKYFFLWGHLKPGVTGAQAAAEMDLIAKRLSKQYPRDYPKRFQARVAPLTETVVGKFRTTLYILMGAVGLLLLIASVNVANLLLARATAREKEISIRASLGATRWRIVRQLLVESLLLALGSAAAGCLFAYGGLKGLLALMPPQTIPDEAVVRLNPRVLLFTLALSVFTAVLFGLAPALRAAKCDLAEALKASGKGMSSGLRHGNLRSGLVVTEVALSLVLLAGAGLLMRSFFKLTQVDLGLDPKNILVARLPLPPGRYDTAQAKQRFFSQLLARLHALPGVVVATETSTLPPYGGIGTELDIPGKTHSEKWEAMYQLCSEGYARTLGLRLDSGRFLSEADVNGARKVAVINRSLARKYFGKENPLGQRVRVKMLAEIPVPIADPTFEIVGVMADAKNRGVQDPPSPEMFLPYTVTGFANRGILVRTSVDPDSLLATVRREIWAVDNNVALTLTGTLEGFLRQFTYAGPRFSLMLLGFFAATGLVLVAIGVYSVLAYTVSRQTHEIGIRMALGAGQPAVLRMVIAMGARLILLGIAIGLAASFGLTRLIASQLWGISATDPLTIGLVLAVLLVVGLAACYFPARKATRVDPMLALRCE